MASNYVLESTDAVGFTRELIFAGDNVRLAGQIEYPRTNSQNGTFPLLFIIPHACCNTRKTYEHYAELALNSGYAVFRWDKRGTGRSGASGRGSTTQDTVNAYETALDQPKIDNNRVVILAQGEGSSLLGKAFGLFARIARPKAVILVGNMLKPDAITAIDAPIYVMHGSNDWLDAKTFGKEVVDAHNQVYNADANYFVAVNADRLLLTDDGSNKFHVGAKQVMQDWLMAL